MSSANKKASDRSTRKRKTYTRPKLVSFGKIADLTQTTGNMGNRDGGTGKKHSTGL